MKEKIIKYLLFDFDGTLFDTKRANFIAYKKAFKYAGINIKEKDYYSAFGLRFDEMTKKIAPNTTTEEKQFIKITKAKYYLKNISQIKPNNHLINFIKLVKKEHKISLVTTASKENVMNILKHFQINGYFDLIVCGEDVINGKPDPECYKTAIKKLGAKPEQCLIFEDSDIGLIAAKKSGANVIKVEIDE